MTSAMTRRTALTAVGAGTIAALTACSASLTTNTASANTSGSASVANNASKPTPSERSDYSGTVEFNSYDTSAGQYKPATRTSPPQNIPKPIKPENMSEHSVAGLYSTIGFLSATITYIFIANDSKPLEDLPLSTADISNLKKRLTDVGQGLDGMWFENLKVTCSLNTAQPTQNGDNYTWPAKYTTSIGSFIVYRGKSMDIPSNKQTSTIDSTITARYENERWVLQTDSSSNSGDGFSPPDSNFKV